MLKPSLHPLLLLLLATLTTPASAASKAKDAIHLSKIKSLTFRSGQLTTSRRLSPVPQTLCTGGNACNLFTPDTIRCTNAGSSYSSADVEWTCTASLPPEFKLGGTDVVCEGYEIAEDEMVLRGSCGVEYRLVLTELGEEKFGRQGGGGWLGPGKKGRSGGGGQEGDGTAHLFWIIFVGVLGWMAYSYYSNRNRRGPRPRPLGGLRWGGGGGGGGGDDGNDDPPPPYSQYPGKASSSSSRTGGWGSGGTRAPRQQQQQGWRPGFWTGAAAGAAGTWLASGRGGGRTQAQQQSQPSMFGQRRQDVGSSSQAGPSYSSERYTSTGFGGTRRR